LCYYSSENLQAVSSPIKSSPNKEKIYSKTAVRIIHEDKFKLFQEFTKKSGIVVSFSTFKRILGKKYQLANCRTDLCDICLKYKENMKKNVEISLRLFFNILFFLSQYFVIQVKKRLPLMKYIKIVHIGKDNLTITFWRTCQWGLA
jgi:hypothetical protein